MWGWNLALNSSGLLQLWVSPGLIDVAKQKESHVSISEQNLASAHACQCNVWEWNGFHIRANTCVFSSWQVSQCYGCISIHNVGFFSLSALHWMPPFSLFPLHQACHQPLLFASTLLAALEHCILLCCWIFNFFFKTFLVTSMFLACWGIFCVSQKELWFC